MDVSNGLSVVTPTLDAWVLRVLVQTTRPFSGQLRRWTAGRVPIRD